MGLQDCILCVVFVVLCLQAYDPFKIYLVSFRNVILEKPYSEVRTSFCSVVCELRSGVTTTRITGFVLRIFWVQWLQQRNVLCDCPYTTRESLHSFQELSILSIWFSSMCTWFCGLDCFHVLEHHHPSRWNFVLIHVHFLNMKSQM